MRHLVPLLILALSSVLCVHAATDAVPAEALRQRATLIREARVQWGIDAPVATFAAQIHQESRWRSDAVSPVGARSVAQVMPATAAWLAQVFPTLSSGSPSTQRLTGDETAPAFYSTPWAIRALVIYDRWIWQRVAGADECQRMAFALRGYNGGLGWVRRDKALATSRGLNAGVNFGSVDTVNAGRNAAAFAENTSYPRLILSHQPRYVAAGFGRGVCA